ncbi:MAG: hypothetical protein E6K84_04135 [Thaumarchaeota archaeon]|nr:MAG: hypothetical protein E6K84_04135 [Nitrososphaerota archaeon]
MDYKARWEGIPVFYVAAWGTSAKCATCGSRTYPNADRTLPARTVESPSTGTRTRPRTSWPREA